jgi:hypothetical protein
MSTHGYIYVLEDESNICKIGFSRIFPTHRQKQISGNYHKDFKLVGVYESDQALLEEKMIHEKLKEFRIKREWFKLTFEEIKDITFFNFLDGNELEEVINEKKNKIKKARPKRDFKLIVARMPKKMLKEIDNSNEKRTGLSRNAWILEAFDEKLRMRL